MRLEDEIIKLQLAEQAKEQARIESQAKRHEAFVRQKAQLEQEEAALRLAELARRDETRNRLQKALNLLEPEPLLREVQKLWGKGSIDPEPNFSIGHSSRYDVRDNALWFIRHAYPFQEEQFKEVQGRMLYSDGFDGYETTTVHDGWKQVIREVCIGVGVEESKRREGSPILSAIVRSGDIKQGYIPQKLSSTPFLAGEIDLTKANVTRFVAEHYTALYVPPNLPQAAKREPWIKRIFG